MVQRVRDAFHGLVVERKFQAPSCQIPIKSQVPMPKPQKSGEKWRCLVIGTWSLGIDWDLAAWDLVICDVVAAESVMRPSCRCACSPDAQPVVKRAPSSSKSPTPPCLPQLTSKHRAFGTQTSISRTYKPSIFGRIFTPKLTPSISARNAFSAAHKGKNAFQIFFCLLHCVLGFRKGLCFPMHLRQVKLAQISCRRCVHFCVKNRSLPDRLMHDEKEGRSTRRLFRC
jgi:hypothetical protein